MNRTRIAWVTLVAATSVCAQKHDKYWHGDFDKAVKVAKRKNKDLFVDFTGSDWCKWCIKLDDEVLSRPEFIKKARKRLVLVALDFPSGEDRKRMVPNPARNQALATKYSVSGYPTVLLLSRDGTVLGRTGYRKGGAKAYAKHIEDLLARGKKVLKGVATLERKLKFAKGDAQEPLVRDALARLKPMTPGATGSERLCRIVERAFDLDPTNEKGLLHEVIRTTLGNRTATDQILDRIRKYDPKNEKKILQSIVLSRFEVARDKPTILLFLDEIDRVDAAGARLNPKTSLNLHYNAALWADHFKDLPRAKKYAKAACDLGPGDAARSELEKILAR